MLAFHVVCCFLLFVLLWVAAYATVVHGVPVVATVFAAAFAVSFAAFAADPSGAFFSCVAAVFAGLFVCAVVLFFLLFVLFFSVVCAAAFCCSSCCFLGRRPLNPTLAVLDLPKCQELFYN